MVSSITNSVVSQFKLWKGTTSVKTVSASQLSSEEISFSDLAEVIPANTTVSNYRLTTSLVKDSNNSGASLQYRLSAYSVEDYDEGDAVYDTAAENVANKVDGIISLNGVDGADEAGVANLTSSRVVTIVGVGSLYVSMDNTVADTDSDTFQLAGTNSGPLASLKLRAENEDVKVTKIKVTASDVNVANNISKLSLYDGSTVVAETTNIAQTTEFDNLNIVVPQTSKIYTLKATLNKIGQNEPGTIGSDVTFNFNSIEAQGNASGDDLAANTVDGVLSGEIAYDKDADGTFGEAGDTSTAESKKMGAVASMISGVALVNSALGETLNTSISSGVSANAAIIRVVTPASSNTLQNGETVKTLINKIKVRVEATTHATSSADGVTYTASIKKIGGSGNPINGTVAYDNASELVLVMFNSPPLVLIMN